MRSRAARHPTLPATPRLRRRIVIRAAGLLLALVLTIAGVVQMRALWRKLPHPSLEALDRHRASRAFADLQSRMSAEARDGLFLAYASNQFTAALHAPARLPDIRENVRQAVATVRGSALGRLQLAALAMLNFEHAGVPPEQWWPQLRTYLAGLQEARFAHHLPPYIAANARVYESLGLDPATAWRTAVGSSFAHGPLLQYVTARLELLAETALAADDTETASYVRGLSDRLLAEWIVEPGPPTLRMLAAQLLADSLAARRPAPSGAAPLVVGLRDWHRLARGHRERLPQGVALLNTSHQPELAIRAHILLTQLLGTTLTLLGATLGVGIVAVCGAFAWLAADRGGAGRGHALETGVALVPVALVWSMIFPSVIEADLRRVAVPEIGWLWHPYVSAGVLLVLFLALGLFAREARTRGRWSYLGGSAARVWLVLSVALVAATFAAGWARQEYVADNAELLRASWQQPVAPATPGPHTASAPPPVFDQLRSWAGLSE